MAFARPSLSDLVTRIKGDLRGRLEIGGPLLRRAMADVLATVWAGAIHGVYGFIQWLSKQIFADQSDIDQLIRQAAIYGITLIPAQFASGNVTATGSPDGTPIPTGTIIKLDSVTTYTVTTGQVIASGTATLPVTAVLAGSAANVPAGTALTFENPIANINATATVATGDIDGGEDVETPDELRARLLLRLQEPPEGGANQDYIAWTLAAGVGATRVWVFPNENGPGTVVVRFVEDNNISSIFPGGGDVATVQAALNAQRPITATVTAVAPTNLAVPFTIHLVPSNVDTQAAVAAELADLLFRVGQPGDAAGDGTILLSQILTAIGNGEGVTDFSLTVPSANVVPGLGQLPTVGTITWV